MYSTLSVGGGRGGLDAVASTALDCDIADVVYWRGNISALLPVSLRCALREKVAFGLRFIGYGFAFMLFRANGWHACMVLRQATCCWRAG